MRGRRAGGGEGSAPRPPIGVRREAQTAVGSTLSAAPEHGPVGVVGGAVLGASVEAQAVAVGLELECGVEVEAVQFVEGALGDVEAEVEHEVVACDPSRHPSPRGCRAAVS